MADQQLAAASSSQNQTEGTPYEGMSEEDRRFHAELEFVQALANPRYIECVCSVCLLLKETV